MAPTPLLFLMLLGFQRPSGYLAQDLLVERCILFLDFDRCLLPKGVDSVLVLLVEDGDGVQQDEHCS